MLLFKSDLYKIAKARLKNDDDVYDVIQETMITSFKSIKRLKDPLCFKSWIIKILISHSNKIYHKRKKYNIIPLEEAKNYYTAINNSNIENIEGTLDFNFICKNLKYEDRIIMVLYYIEKFTDKEIGEILNLKENTVKTKRTRAKEEIKKLVKKEENVHGRIR